MTALTGKTALVTGASRGIGRATALRLAQAGATVAVHYRRRQDAAEDTLREIEAAGGSGFTIQADLATIAGIAGLFDGLRGRGLTTLDILVNNAGVGAGGTIADTDEATFDQMFTVNMKAPFFVIQNALPLIPDGGRIINISSMVALAAYPHNVAYSAAKAALNAMTKSVAAGLGARRIAVNAVAPGATNTDFLSGIIDNREIMSALEQGTAMGRIGQTDDIAGVVAFLASPEAGWITGQVIAASGGMHL